MCGFRLILFFSRYFLCGNFSEVFSDSDMFAFIYYSVYLPRTDNTKHNVHTLYFVEYCYHRKSTISVKRVSYCTLCMSWISIAVARCLRLAACEKTFCTKNYVVTQVNKTYSYKKIVLDRYTFSIFVLVVVTSSVCPARYLPSRGLSRPQIFWAFNRFSNIIF